MLKRQNMNTCTLVDTLIAQMSNTYPKTWTMCSGHETHEISPQIVSELMSAASETNLTRSPMKTYHVLSLAAKWVKTRVQVVMHPSALAFINTHKLLLGLPTDSLSRSCYTDTPVHISYDIKALITANQSTSKNNEKHELICEITADVRGIKTMQILKLYESRPPAMFRIPLIGKSINDAIINSGIIKADESISALNQDKKTEEMELVNISLAAISALNRDKKNELNKYHLSKNDIEIINL
ncbi:hypothetical protein [Serratia symbiotica]|uniref:hypothetical protein n=1 Tax=Serratia symbiotica TaxID=138074 RepID=UPI001AE19598|nr:hypothetical protein [Serratia symbiotica]QTP13372.1 hypothetical protein GPZ83_0000085 [Serratia symbiotica]